MADVVGSARIRLEVDGSTLPREVQQAGDQAARSLQTTLGNAGRAVGESLAAGVGIATAGFAALTTATLASGAGFNILSQGATQALTATLGTRDAANALIAEVIELNQTSAFSRQAFLASTQQLVGFGVQAQDVTGVLDAMQNAIVATGGGEAEFERLTFYLAQVASQGKVTGETMMRLGELGINATKLLADQTGQSVESIQAAVSAGEIGLSELTEALSTRYAGAVEGYANTWTGAVGRIRASMRNLGSELVEPFIALEEGGAAIDSLNLLTDAMNSLRTRALPGLMPLVEGLAGSMVNLASAAAEMIDRIPDDVFTSLADSLSGLGPLVAGVGAAIATAFSHNIPVLDRFAKGINPVVAGIAALIAASPELRTAVGGALSDIAAEAGPFLNAVADIARELLGALAPSLSTVVGSLGEFLAAVIPVASNLLGGLTPAVSAAGSVLGVLVEVVGLLLPVLTPVVTVIGAVAEAFAALPEPIQAVAVGLLAFRTMNLAGVFTPATEALTRFREQMAVQAGLAQSAGRQIGTMGAAYSVAAANVGRLGAAFGGVTAALGGPVGLAITGVTLALGFLASRHREAATAADDQKARLDSLIDTLDDTTGAVTRETRAAVARAVAEGDLADAARDLGIAQSDIAAAALGNAKAQQAVTTAIERSVAAVGQQAVWEKFGSQLSDAGVSQAELNAALTDGSGLADLFAQALGGGSLAAWTANDATRLYQDSTEAAGESAAALTGFVDSTSEAFENERDIAEAVRDTLFKLSDAEIALERELARASEAIIAQDEALSGSHSAAADLAEEMAVLADETSTADQRARALNDALTILSGGSLSLEQAQAASNRAVRAVNEAMAAQIEETAKTGEAMFTASGQIDTTTAAGDRLLQSVTSATEAMATEAIAAYDVAVANGEGAAGGLNAASKAARRVYDDFIDAATSAGISEDAAHDLATQYGLIPDDVETVLKATDRASDVAKNARDAINKIPKEFTITIRATALGLSAMDPRKWQAFAQGGIVDEPTLGLIGEAGPEVVLPLTKRDRARELAAQAGLWELLGDPPATNGQSGAVKAPTIINNQFHLSTPAADPAIVAEQVLDRLAARSR